MAPPLTPSACSVDSRRNTLLSTGLTPAMRRLSLKNLDEDDFLDKSLILTYQRKNEAESRPVRGDEGNLHLHHLHPHLQPVKDDVYLHPPKDEFKLALPPLLPLSCAYKREKRSAEDVAAVASSDMEGVCTPPKIPRYSMERKVMKKGMKPKKTPFSINPWQEDEVHQKVRFLWSGSGRNIVTSEAGMYGELRESGLRQITEYLVKECWLNEKSIFCDIGSGRGCPNIVASHHASIGSSVGIELGELAFILSLKNCCFVLEREIERMQLNGEDSSLLPPSKKISFGNVDAGNLRTLEPVTHVFSFDAAMPGWLIYHICKLFNQSKTSVCYCSFRADLIEKFWLKGTKTVVIPGSMTGSGEGRSCHIYLKHNWKESLTLEYQKTAEILHTVQPIAGNVSLKDMDESHWEPSSFSDIVKISCLPASLQLELYRNKVEKWCYASRSRRNQPSITENSLLSVGGRSPQASEDAADSIISREEFLINQTISFDPLDNPMLDEKEYWETHDKILQREVQRAFDQIGLLFTEKSLYEALHPNQGDSSFNSHLKYEKGKKRREKEAFYETDWRKFFLGDFLAKNSEKTDFFEKELMAPCADSKAAIMKMMEKASQIFNVEENIRLLTQSKKLSNLHSPLPSSIDTRSYKVLEEESSYTLKCSGDQAENEDDIPLFSSSLIGREKLREARSSQRSSFRTSTPPPPPPPRKADNLSKQAAIPVSCCSVYFEAPSKLPNKPTFSIDAHTNALLPNASPHTPHLLHTLPLTIPASNTFPPNAPPLPIKNQSEAPFPPPTTSPKKSMSSARKQWRNHQKENESSNSTQSLGTSKCNVRTPGKKAATATSLLRPTAYHLPNLTTNDLPIPSIRTPTSHSRSNSRVCRNRAQAPSTEERGSGQQRAAKSNTPHTHRSVRTASPADYDFSVQKNAVKIPKKTAFSVSRCQKKERKCADSKADGSLSDLHLPQALGGKNGDSVSLLVFPIQFKPEDEEQHTLNESKTWLLLRDVKKVPLFNKIKQLCPLKWEASQLEVLQKQNQLCANERSIWWVRCDKCKKWRIVPDCYPQHEIDMLRKNVWECSMVKMWADVDESGWRTCSHPCDWGLYAAVEEEEEEICEEEEEEEGAYEDLC